MREVKRGIFARLSGCIDRSSIQAYSPMPLAITTA